MVRLIPSVCKKTIAHVDCNMPIEKRWNPFLNIVVLQRPFKYVKNYLKRFDTCLKLFSAKPSEYNRLPPVFAFAQSALLRAIHQQMAYVHIPSNYLHPLGASDWG